VLYQVLESFVFIHGRLVNHGIHFLFHFIHEIIGTLILSELNTESGKGTSCATQFMLKATISVGAHPYGPDVRSNKFFDNVSTAEECASQVEGTLTIPESNCTMIVGGGTGSCYLLNR
jgi:hypothetical protein